MLWNSKKMRDNFINNKNNESVYIKLEKFQITSFVFKDSKGGNINCNDFTK